MRNYETIYKLILDLKNLASDDEIFAASERDRLLSERISKQVRSAFPHEDEREQRLNLREVLQKTRLVQFFDYHGKRFFLDLPHLRIFSYLHDCLGKYAPNESLADFAVNLAMLARDNVNYSNMRVADTLNALAAQ